MKTNQDLENLIVFLINCQVLIAINIRLYCIWQVSKVKVLKERYQCNK